MNLSEISKLQKAGEIAKEAKALAKEIAKPGVPLLKIAEKIESLIAKKGASPAFPVTLCINEVAAHSTPKHDDKEKASGLLKIDIGVHISGFIADTAISLDLENSKENQELIKAAERARDRAIESISLQTELREIGKVIEETIKSFGFSPIINLSGHSIDPYDLHSGITIPNCDNGYEATFPIGVYAVEPFVTPGSGKVINGKPSGIYHLESEGNVRDPLAREILKYIKDQYKTLPFCSRWLVNKFGTRALIALKRMEDASLLHHYPQLIESSRKKVSQAEHTVILLEDKMIITT